MTCTADRGQWAIEAVVPRTERQKRRAEQAASAKRDDEDPVSSDNPLQPAIERKNFGRLNSAWMEVEVQDEGRKAILRSLCLGGDATVVAEDVVEILQDHYLVSGSVDMEALEKVFDAAFENPLVPIRLEVVVASVSEEFEPSDARVLFLFQEQAGTSDERVYESILEIMERPTLDDVLAADISVHAVCPGETLATLHSADLATTVPLAGSDSVPLRAGENVATKEHRYVSEIYGYLSLVDGRLSVVDPTWMSADGIEAHYVHFPAMGECRAPQTRWLHENLERRGIRFGIRNTIVESVAACVDADLEKQAYPVAKARVAVDGMDGTIQFTFDPEVRAGTMMADGTVDMRERNSAVAVRNGQMLAEVFPPTEGREGRDLTGQSHPASTGKATQLKTGLNVRSEFTTIGHKLCYSEIEGNVSLVRGVLAVRPVLHIDGDVDYAMGNVDAGKHVVVTGSVRGGFKIRTNGNVAVAGVAEAGAEIISGGDVIVAQGILGHKTKVIAVGEVTTRLIQNSTVSAGGSVRVGSYIMNARVRAGGLVITRPEHSDRGHERDGLVLGGRVIASRGVRVRTVGSDMAEHTEVGVGRDLETEAKLERIRRGKTYCETNILRILRTLGTKRADAATVKRLLAGATPERRKELIEHLRKMRELMSRQEQAIQKESDLGVEIDQILADARIVITKKLIPDVLIVLGPERLRVSEELEAPTFRQSSGGIVWELG